MSVFAECSGRYYLYKNARDAGTTYTLPIKAYETCIVLDSLETSRFTKIKIRTATGHEGWIHTSCLKKV